MKFLSSEAQNFRPLTAFVTRALIKSFKISIVTDHCWKHFLEVLSSTFAVIIRRKIHFGRLAVKTLLSETRTYEINSAFEAHLMWSTLKHFFGGGGKPGGGGATDL